FRAAFFVPAFLREAFFEAAFLRRAAIAWVTPLVVALRRGRAVSEAGDPPPLRSGHPPFGEAVSPRRRPSSLELRSAEHPWSASLRDRLRLHRAPGPAT